MPHDEDDADDDWNDVDDSDDGYVSCPYCGATMLEDAEYCPKCDRWITNDDLPAKRLPWWIVVIVMAVIVAMVASIMH